MPLVIAADGVTALRPSPKTPKGKIVWREVKIALLARLAKHQTKTKKPLLACIKGGWSQFGNRCSQTSPTCSFETRYYHCSSSLISMERTGFGDSISALLTVLLAS